MKAQCVICKEVKPQREIAMKPWLKCGSVILGYMCQDGCEIKKRGYGGENDK